jgi:two-component system phosphate regulon response regulator PhoB
MARKVLVVEDETDIAELERIHLEMAGFSVIVQHSGDSGLRAAQMQNPDLILLDIMLPGMSGLEVCQILRNDPKTNKIPIIMVSAKGAEEDIVKGLELGAEDYVTKPFSPKVLMARVLAVLRRASVKPPRDESEIVFGDITINAKRVEVHVKGEKIDLTQSEFKILQHLVCHPGWVFTRAQIVSAIHGDGYAVTDRTIDFQMVGLRKKLGICGDYIETVRGVGYRFKDHST